MPFEELANFDLGTADLTVWVVKKSGGLRDAPPIFTARWVETDERLNAGLKREQGKAFAEMLEASGAQNK